MVCNQKANSIQEMCNSDNDNDIYVSVLIAGGKCESSVL